MDTSKPVSKTRVMLMWLMMVSIIVFLALFFFLHAHNQSPPEETGAPEVSPLLRSVVLLFIGLFLLAGGVAAYLVLIFTCCLTFSYQNPVWNSVKAKKYLANIFVTVGLSLGIGFTVSAFLSPLLAATGLPPAQADVMPVLGVLIGFQVMQLWVLIWSPLERRVIVKRLGAMGITPEQLKGAALVGISNPASGMVKRFGAIEEDMGALWVTPDRLAFRGDVEQFDLTREMVTQVERRADTKSTTVLAGIAHVVLHVQLPDGSVRQMRLHTEGLWTLGQKKRAMDALAESIDGWWQGAAQPVSGG